jgi:hypothetical protein
VRRFLQAGHLAYLKVGQIGTVEVPDLPVVDNVSAIFRMSSHGTSAVALVVAPANLFRCETETCS